MSVCAENARPVRFLGGERREGCWLVVVVMHRAGGRGIRRHHGLQSLFGQYVPCPHHLPPPPQARGQAIPAAVEQTPLAATRVRSHSEQALSTKKKKRPDPPTTARAPAV